MKRAIAAAVLSIAASVAFGQMGGMKGMDRKDMDMKGMDMKGMGEKGADSALHNAGENAEGQEDRFRVRTAGKGLRRHIGEVSTAPPALVGVDRAM